MIIDEYNEGAPVVIGVVICGPIGGYFGGEPAAIFCSLLGGTIGAVIMDLTAPKKDEYGMEQ